MLEFILQQGNTSKTCHILKDLFNKRERERERSVCVCVREREKGETINNGSQKFLHLVSQLTKNQFRYNKHFNIHLISLVDNIFCVN